MRAGEVGVFRMLASMTLIEKSQFIRVPGADAHGSCAWVRANRGSVNRSAAGVCPDNAPGRKPLLQLREPPCGMRQLGHHHVAGEVLVLCAEPVIDP